ncbi:hypothetical protein SSX86_031169 [Deinandra increscens subsp. villosa]|uniref:Uncharacterized protein n=1 Tax=Deinandra increscens subsp. villosa TaxID=3103831 RepID=A0AAP0C6Y7_9ASTR
MVDSANGATDFSSEMEVDAFRRLFPLAISRAPFATLDNPNLWTKQRLGFEERNRALTLRFLCAGEQFLFSYCLLLTMEGSHQLCSDPCKRKMVDSANGATDFSSEMEVDAFRRLFPLRFHERHLLESVRPDARPLGKARETSLALGAVASADGSALAKIGSTVRMYMVQVLRFCWLSYISIPVLHIMALSCAPMTITREFSGLKPGPHGFHVHALAVTTNGCMSTGFLERQYLQLLDASTSMQEMLETTSILKGAIDKSLIIVVEHLAYDGSGFLERRSRFKHTVDLTTSDWDECNFWLETLKQMIKIKPKEKQIHGSWGWVFQFEKDMSKNCKPKILHCSIGLRQSI